MTVVAIVPAKDRADSIGSTIASLRTVRTIDRILVVDDGSTDDTTAVARSAGAAVLRLGANRGKAGAVATGVAAEPDADIYVLVDADVRDDAAQVAALLTPVLAGEADLAIGVLPSAGTRGGFGLVRRFAHWGVQRGSGFDAKAPLSGQRVVRGDFLRGMDGVARFGLEVAMTIDAARAGARVVEIEVPMEHLHTGRSVAGFAHRGRQGRDVFEALWPRLVPRVVRRIGLVALVFAFLALSFVGSHANTVASTPLTRRARHVVIIGVPHLGLGDLGNGEMPNLDRLMAGGSVAKMTIQTGGGTQSSSEYATLGASAQVTGPGVTQVAGRDERIEGSPAIDVLERRSGARPSGALIVASMPAVLRSSGKLENSQPGALGDALHAAGLTTAVVANSDTVDDSGLRSTSAPAAFAVTSTAGAIDAGSVAPSLTHRDPRRPFGMNADVSAIAREFAKVAPTSAVTVIDPGDTDRAAAYAGGAGKDQADVLRKQALAETDRVIGSIDRRLPTDTLLIVTAMSPPTSQAELVPIVMSGAGVTQGQLLSPSTGQDGLVTLTNVAPTVLASLGVAVPPKMIGRPIRFTTTKPDLSAFRRSNKISVDRDRAYSTFLHSFIQVQILLYLLAAIALVRTGTPRLARRVLRFGVVTVALVPLMTFVIRIFPVLGSFGTGTVALLWALSALISWVIHDRGRSPWGPLVAVCSANIVLLAIDLSLGGPLQDSSLLGFSPIAAARFSGVGNSTYGVLAGSVMIVMAWIVGRSTRPRDALWPAVAVGIIVAAVDGAPWLGSDVGGILSLIPAIGILAYLLSGRRLNVMTIVVPFLAAVGFLGAVIGYEALQPKSSRDHIGTFFLGGSAGGAQWTTILRKEATDVSLLMTSQWSRLILVVVLFTVVVYLWGRCWPRIMPSGSPQRHALVALAIVAFLGYALNDSGAMAAAVVLIYLGALVALPALSDRRPHTELFEPADVADT